MPIRGLRAAALSALLIAPAMAQEGDADAGRALAEAHCARCHAIGSADESPHPDAPPMRSFAEKWPVEYLEEALAEGIVVGHGAPEMPAFAFHPADIADLIAFLRVAGEP